MTERRLCVSCKEVTLRHRGVCLRCGIDDTAGSYGPEVWSRVQDRRNRGTALRGAAGRLAAAGRPLGARLVSAYRGTRLPQRSWSELTAPVERGAGYLRTGRLRSVLRNEHVRGTLALAAAATVAVVLVVLTMQLTEPTSEIEIPRALPSENRNTD